MLFAISTNCVEWQMRRTQSINCHNEKLLSYSDDTSTEFALQIFSDILVVEHDVGKRVYFSKPTIWN